jgi:hypothetical protein
MGVITIVRNVLRVIDWTKQGGQKMKELAKEEINTCQSSINQTNSIK